MQYYNILYMQFSFKQNYSQYTKLQPTQKLELKENKEFPTHNYDMTS